MMVNRIHTPLLTSGIHKGLSGFWLWVPRIMAAIVLVHLFNLMYKTALILKMIAPKPADGLHA